MEPVQGSKMQLLRRIPREKIRSAILLIKAVHPVTDTMLDNADIYLELDKVFQTARTELLALNAARESLVALLTEWGTAHSSYLQTNFNDLDALLSCDALAFVELTQRDRTHWEIAINKFSELRAIAESAPRLRSAQAYLVATRLLSFFDEEFGYPDIAELIKECKILSVSLNPVILSSTKSGIFLGLERFERFRASYVDTYRTAHRDYYRTQDRFIRSLAEARHINDTLSLFDSLQWLQVEPAENSAGIRLRELEGLAKQCGEDPGFRVRETAVCATCGFQLGSEVPLQELSDLQKELLERLRVQSARFSHFVSIGLNHLRDIVNRIDTILRVVQSGEYESMAEAFNPSNKQALELAIDASEIVNTQGAVGGNLGLRAGLTYSR